MNQDPCLSCYTDAQPAAAPLANHPILRLVSFVTELQQPTEPVSSQPENQADPGKKKKKERKPDEFEFRKRCYQSLVSWFVV